MALSRGNVANKEQPPLVLRCELQRVVLTQCDLRRGSLATEDRGPYKLHLNSNVEFTELRDAYLYTIVRLKASSHADGGKSLFDVDLAYELEFLYHGPKPKDVEIREFIETTPLFLAWPYLRESLNGLCSRMELSPPPLPLLKTLPASANGGNSKRKNSMQNLPRPRKIKNR